MLSRTESIEWQFGANATDVGTYIETRVSKFDTVCRNKHKFKVQIA